MEPTDTDAVPEGGPEERTEFPGKREVATSLRASTDANLDVEVVVVGAGFAGLYMLHRLRRSGFSTVVVEAADDVGGTWYWNRYPGARCDVQTVDYSYTFDPELDEEWQWSEKYATQPEILRYIQYVADRFDLRRDIRFSTRVEAATWDEDGRLWRIRTDRGDEIACRWYVMATGCLSMPTVPDIEGIDSFEGESYFTSRWPHEGVDFTGKRVAVIGTGSSGIQSIPIIAQEADQLTVFQRTPNFSIPAGNGPIPEDKWAAVENDRAAYREAARWSRGGVPMELPLESALALDPEERERRYEEVYARGDLFFTIGGAAADLLTNREANETAAEFFRNKIRSVVKDPETAEKLCPKDHPFATKRPCLDSGYYETFNLDHVRLVDLRSTPITRITPEGIDTTEKSFSFDAIVFATGFDAMTGALVGVDIRGPGGRRLADAWKEGPETYLGLTSVGFPNLFMITGPGSPSVLSNMMVSIEQHVDWIADCLDHLREAGFDRIEPTETAQACWVRHVNDAANITLYPEANSWYMGANVPGKPRVFLPYVGGVDAYRKACNEVVERGYLGFERSGPAGRKCVEGVVCRLQPDVFRVLEALEEMGVPRLETLSVEEARAFMETMAAQSPPGPEVGEVVDGALPGPESELEYRLYRPRTEGPHPVVVYFHGGGWVLGNHTSDDAFCRDLCLRSDAVVVSVNYRHAPEHRFPAAVEDAVAAVRWVADHAGELGGVPGRVAVSGWSAGGNLATVACQELRRFGGPEILAQVLVTPVTDSDPNRPSCLENGEGYFLTADLMRWFWDHYTEPGERTDPRVVPLRAENLAGLPPAVVVTAEFDPLRDEGDAYAEALASAGVPTRHVRMRGQIHTSLTSVGLFLSPEEHRDEIGRELHRLLRAPVVESASR